MNRLRALVVEDDVDFRESLAALVQREVFEVRQAGTLEEARKRLAESPIDVVLVDPGLPDGDGLDLLRDEQVRADVVVITGSTSVEAAVDALRQGATDYLTKPVDRPRLQSVLSHLGRARALESELSELRGELRELGHFGPMVGRSPAMQHVYDLIGKVAPTLASVLVTGESGTGKELVAQTVHALSPRKDRPFVAVNCGAISPNLIESELFGHEKGSFTGAERRHRGYFEQASGGTLLLDEITEMPIELQPKLLRVLETGVIQRVGGGDEIPVDVRLIAATNRDPAEAVQRRTLREDLLYRLNVFPIRLPPVRARGDDVTLLGERFLAALNERDGTSVRFSDAALERLRALPWPGNVRELRNAVERAAILADRVIEPEMLPSPGPRAGDTASHANGGELRVRVGSSIADVEKRLILATLESIQGDKRRAAEILGISVKTLYNRLTVYRAAEGA
jgi:DNA-binding NtrC family response regulator